MADGDQTSSDLDQTASDADRSASTRDQIASERDQQAADHDQEVSERASGAPGAIATEYEQSRRARSKSTLDRAQTSQARSETARIRDEVAAQRDRMADERDVAARARDEFAAALDAEIDRLEHEALGEEELPHAVAQARAAADRKRAAASRARAAALRKAAARDRDRAAQDRRQAALDRAAAAAELALEGVDELTGALVRRIGLGAIQRELDRAQRTDERLVVAFVDVVGLKTVNDTQGHGAGDALLHQVARSIMQHLRSYDVIVRFGGDEFVCSLSGQDVDGVRDRFERIALHLAASADGATFTLGLAEQQPGDTLDELIRRADAAMLEARRA